MIYRKLLNGVVEEKQIEEVSFDKHYDAIVVGVGTAGSYAVLSAALKEMLCDKNEYKKIIS